MISTEVMNDAHTKIDGLYQAVFGRLVHAAEYSGVPTEQAEDIAQTAFMRLVERSAEIRLDNRAEVIGWLNTVVRNLARDYHRNQKPQMDNTDDAAINALVAPDHQSPERRLQIHQTLRSALGKLTIDQLEALMWIAHGFTPQEIAEGTGVKPDAVNMNAWRGRQKLK